MRLAAWLLVVVVIAIAHLAPAPRRINIRWTTAPFAERERMESGFHLSDRRYGGDRTWSYVLRDASPDSLRHIVTDPRVEDTAFIDRSRLELEPERPAVRGRVRALYESGPLRPVTRYWLVLAGMLLVMGALIDRRWLRAWGSEWTRPLAVALLVGAAGIRVGLVNSGGQFFWPDESRYYDARALAKAVITDDRAQAATALQQPVYAAFKVVATIPAAVEGLRGLDPRIPAMFFGLFSVVNIWLTMRLARRLGSSRVEALAAGALMATSTSMLYFARHLLPYDAAMTLALAALYVGVSPRARSGTSLACGVLAGAAFLVYAGYWTLGGAACALHVLHTRDRRQAIRRGLICCGGVALSIGLGLAAYRMTGRPWMASVTRFAGAVTQGEHAEGWSLPFEYLWHAEHALLVVWLAAVAWCVTRWRRSMETPVTRVALLGTAFIYVALVVFSTGLHLFVVYGRLARQVVPFLCLLTAAVLADFIRSVPHRFRPLAAAAVALGLSAQAAVSFSPVFRQEFPEEFIQRAHDLADRAGAAALLTLYAEHIYPEPVRLEVPNGYREIAAARHPLQYRPYQYEGYTPRERRALRTVDIRMRALIADRN